MMFPRASLVILATLSSAFAFDSGYGYYEKCEPDLKDICYHNTKGYPSHKIECNSAYKSTHYVCIPKGGTLGITAEYKYDCEPKEVYFKLEDYYGETYKNNESTHPWSMFKNDGKDIWGKDLKEGHYKLKVTADENYKTTKDIDVKLEVGYCHTPSMSYVY